MPAKPLLLALITLVACSDPATSVGTTDAAGAVGDVAGTATVDLSAHGLPLLLVPPDLQTTGGQAPAILWKDGPGVLEIKAGDHFGLTIAEEPGDPARLKADLDRDLLQKHELLKDTADLVVYRSSFPDDPSLVFIHFYQVIRTADRQFVVQDADGMRFNEADIGVMRRSIRMKPAA